MLHHFLLNLEKFFNASPLSGLAASFLAGIVVSFSSCIYPLIPITLSILGVAQANSRLKSFSVSLVFVLGIATIYTTLGVIASLLGIFLGNFFNNPFTYILLSTVLLALGFSLVGLIKINLFSFYYNYSPKTEGFSVFILGLVSGLAVIPCNFPVLGSILSLISLKRDVLYGGFALFLFSLGYGLILIVLGTFTSLIRKLPKQGMWLIIIKKAMGVVLITMSIHFFLKFISALK
jgi:thiol:disulfide interchange protein DsbD